MSVESKKSVLSAIVGNTIVMFAKFGVFLSTGSSAMLAEGIHSLADVMNQSLLYIGVIKSENHPDKEHSSGYGRERFIWSLISAVGIFFLGCGVTIYHGVESLLHPHESHSVDMSVSIGVLLFALVVEGYVLYVAYAGLKKQAGTKPFFDFVQNEADPSSVAVLMEDAAACIGVIIAMISILLTHFTHQHYWDAIGSILIGILLGFVAFWLISRNRDLLIGKSIPDEEIERLKEILREKKFLGKIDHIRTEVIGADQYDIQVEIEFDERILSQTMDLNLKEKYESIQCYEDFEKYSLELAVQSMEKLTRTIDELEKEIQKELPNTKFIDIEPN